MKKLQHCDKLNETLSRDEIMSRDKPSELKLKSRFEQHETVCGMSVKFE